MTVPDKHSVLALPPGREPSDEQLEYDIKDLDDPDPKERARAVQEIGYEGGLRFAPRFIAGLEHERDAEVRGALLIALAMLDVRETIPLARARLEDPAMEVRLGAACALAILQDRASFPLLVAAIEAGRLGTRADGLDCEGVLGNLSQGVPEAQFLFRRLAAAKEFEGRLIGLQGLRHLGESLPVDELHRLLASEDMADRAMARLPLACMRDQVLLEWMRRECPWHPALNAYSDPETWAKLDGLHVRGCDLATHTLGEVLDAVALQGGIRIDMGPDVPPGFRNARFGAHRLEVLGFDPTALLVLLGLGSRMLRPDDRFEVTWIAEAGSIRFATLKVAEHHWRTRVPPLSAR